MKPTVGRIVHFVTEDGHHRAALISHLPGGVPADPAAAEATTVDLVVFGNSRAEPVWWAAHDVAQDPSGSTPGTFHEPERSDAPAPAQT